MRMHIRILLALAVLLGFFSCGPKQDENVELSEEERITEGGLKYIHHLKHKKGRKADPNDWFVINFLMVTDKNDTIYNSYKEGRTVDKQYIKMPYPGMIEEAMAHLRIGDSMTVFYPAERVYGQDTSQYHEKVKPGQIIKHIIKVVDILVPAKFAEVKALRQQEMLEKDKERIRQGHKQQNIPATEHKSGLFYLIESNTPALADGPARPGDSIVFHQTATFANGMQFMSTFNEQNPQMSKPLGYVIGSRRVIPAWDIAFTTFMENGTQASIWVPSPLGFGESGSNFGVPADVIIVLKVRIIGLYRAADRAKWPKPTM